MTDGNGLWKICEALDCELRIKLLWYLIAVEKSETTQLRSLNTTAASITSRKTCARQADKAKWISMKKIRSAESATAIVPMDIRPLIYEIRGRQVILDRDLAALYGVLTKNLNKAVKRNAERFPEDFMFQLTKSIHLPCRK